MRAAYAALLAERKTCAQCGRLLHHYEQVQEEREVLCEGCAPKSAGPDLSASVCIMTWGELL